MHERLALYNHLNTVNEVKGVSSSTTGEYSVQAV